jgi:hypothetical protein
LPSSGSSDDGGSTDGVKGRRFYDATMGDKSNDPLNSGFCGNKCLEG